MGSGGDVDRVEGNIVETLLRNVASQPHFSLPGPRLSIERLPADTKIIPGHGPLSTVDDLKTFHAGVRESSNLIREQMKSGKNLEQIQKAGLPSKWDAWASGFINEQRWIEIVYNSYSG